MNKRHLKNLDIDIYFEKIKGLDVYVVPMKRKKDTYITLTVKFGSIHTNFSYDNTNISVPNGTAHFLEHKMFEQRNGKIVFNSFSEKGADINAYTTYELTKYILDCSKNLKQNLKRFLDSVNDLYVTEENIAKEKGIITEEIKSKLDNPYYNLFIRSCYNTYLKSNMKNSVIGTIEDIKNIKKEDLVACYDAFYNPNNMFLVITGNVDESIFDVIKKNSFRKEKNIKILQEKEPLNIRKKYDEFVFPNLEIPKITMNFKIDISKIKYSKFKIINYLNFYFESKIGVTSKLLSDLQEENLIVGNISSDGWNIEDVLTVSLLFESKKYNITIEKILSEIKNKKVDEEDFKRKLKVIISSEIYSSDSMISINSKIADNLIDYNDVVDVVEECESANVNELKEILKIVDFENVSITVVKS